MTTSPRTKTSLKVQINAMRRTLRRLDEEKRRKAINLFVVRLWCAPAIWSGSRRTLAGSQT